METAKQLWARPYVAIGFSYISVDASSTPGPFPMSTTDDSLGIYVGAGVTLVPSKTLSISLEVRGLVGTEIDIAPGVSSDLDYGQFAIVVGYSF